MSDARTVKYVPGLADMSRLAGFQPRTHTGIRVGYVGLVEPTKMHPRFAELSAAVRTRGVHFDVFGDGSWRPELARRFTALGAAERVQFHGPTEDLREALAEIDIFGYPLAPGHIGDRRENNPGGDVGRAFRRWCSVAAGRVSSWSMSARVSCVTERTTISRAIERLAGDEELRRRLGEAATRVSHTSTSIRRQRRSACTRLRGHGVTPAPQS